MGETIGWTQDRLVELARDLGEVLKEAYRYSLHHGKTGRFRVAKVTAVRVHPKLPLVSIVVDIKRGVATASMDTYVGFYANPWQRTSVHEFVSPDNTFMVLPCSFDLFRDSPPPFRCDSVPSFNASRPFDTWSKDLAFVYDSVKHVFRAIRYGLDLVQLTA